MKRNQIELFQGFHLRCITWYHVRFYCADFDKLSNCCPRFLIRKFLTGKFLAVGSIDTSLDGPFALNTWSDDVTSAFHKLIRLFLSSGEVDFLYSRFIRISQRIFWEGRCLRRSARYHMWLACANFDNLCDRG